eukprot:TRINITY_DN3626_c0_g1_i8.p1 TRINITY_DN3626_c0_g1~~TRINITY_DN3626_c0_g1_i8.p1  ORF type:complete len:262 (-),score=15.30 TRINITY_DN3626_c0_g1_i8:216-938(-)
MCIRDSSIFWIISLILIPLSQATVITSASPVFVAIFSYIAFKTKIGSDEVGAGIFGFIGVLVISKAFENSTKVKTTTNYEGVISGILTMLNLALLSVTTKALAKGKDSVLVTLYPYLVCFVFCPLYYLFFNSSAWIGLSLSDIMLIILLGLLNILYNGFFVISLATEKPYVISLLGYLALVVSFLIDICVFGYFPAKTDLIGTFLIVISTLTLIKRAQSKSYLTQMSWQACKYGQISDYG